MPLSELYTGTGTTTLATVAATPVCSLVTPATKRAWVVGVRVSIGISAAAASNTVLFQLFRVTNASSITLGTTTGAAPNDPAGPTTALATFVYAGGTAYGTAPTGTATCLWQQQLPQTTGSSWEEFPPLGYEYAIGVTAGVALWVTCSVSTASTVVWYELVWSE